MRHGQERIAWRVQGKAAGLGIHIVRPGSGQKASYCAGRLPGSLRRCKEKIDSMGSSDAVAVSSLMSPTSGVILPILRSGKGTWGGQELRLHPLCS